MRVLFFVSNPLRFSCILDRLIKQITEFSYEQRITGIKAVAGTGA